MGSEVTGQGLEPSVTVAVIGAGTMGAGVAQVAAAAGHPVVLYDTRNGAATGALEKIHAGLGRLIDRGRMDPAQRDRLLSRIRPARQLEEVAEAGLVIEAIVEDLATKRSLFRQLESLCQRETILASNTSSLSITAIGAALEHPGRLVGMHFFNPAPVMKLVEVVSGLATDPDTAARVHATAAAWGKRPVHARSTPGFIVNRVARPFYAEALRLLEEGRGDCATLDALLRDSGGFRMGPFELMDLIGHDVNHAVTRSVFEAFHQDPRFLPSLLQQELVEAGRLGRKSGRGFYRYDGSEPPPPASADPAPRPETITMEGEPGPAAPLLERWREAGIRIDRVDGDGEVRIGSTRLALSDGRSATRRARDDGIPDTVLFDLALDYAGAGRIGISIADQASAGALPEAVGLLQAAGLAVSVIDDGPGLPLLRTVCMLANEAADAVLLGVCDAAGADTAMRYGVNYPLGPLAWADRLGPKRVLMVLEHLQQAYGHDRYRPSLLLRRLAESDGTFHRDD